MKPNLREAAQAGAPEALSPANWKSVIQMGLGGMLPHMPADVLTPSSLPFIFILFSFSPLPIYPDL